MKKIYIFFLFIILCISFTVTAFAYPVVSEQALPQNVIALLFDRNDITVLDVDCRRSDLKSSSISWLSYDELSSISVDWRTCGQVIFNSSYDAYFILVPYVDTLGGTGRTKYGTVGSLSTGSIYGAKKPSTTVNNYYTNNYTVNNANKSAGSNSNSDPYISHPYYSNDNIPHTFYEDVDYYIKMINERLSIQNAWFKLLNDKLYDIREQLDISVIPGIKNISLFTQNVANELHSFLPRLDDLYANSLSVSFSLDNIITRLGILQTDFISTFYHVDYVDNPILPDAYQEVEYITASGGAYIDTLVSPRFISAIEGDYHIPYSDDFDVVFGSWNALGDGMCSLYRDPYGTSYLAYGDVFYPFYALILSTIDAKFMVHFRVDFHSKFSYFSDSGFDLPFVDDFTSYPLYLFSFNDGGNADGSSSATISHFDIYSSFINMSRHFVPAVRKSDNVAGFYDTVSERFFTNCSSSGAFVAGNSVYHYVPIRTNWFETISDKISSISLSAGGDLNLSPGYDDTALLSKLTDIENALSNIGYNVSVSIDNVTNIGISSDNDNYNVFFVDGGEDGTDDDKSIVDLSKDSLDIMGRLMNFLYQMMFEDSIANGGGMDDIIDFYTDTSQEVGDPWAA